MRLLTAAAVLTALAIRASPNVAQPADTRSSTASPPSAARSAAASKNATTLRSPALESVDLPEVDRLVQAAIAANQLPGAVVVIGRRSGVVFERAYGSRAVLPEREAMTVDSVFDLASLTKPVATATLILQLAAAGALDLDAPVKRYLPAIARFNRGTPTVRQLLIHASGLPPVAPLRPYPDGVSSALEQIAGLRAAASAGSRFAYSDLGFIALGALAEAVTHESLATLARERIFEPLGMRDTGYRPEARLLPRIAPTERIDPRRAELLSEKQREYGVVIRGQVHDPRAFRLNGVAGHAGVFSTAQDLARFARMLLGHGKLDGARILPPNAVDQLTTPHVIGDSVRALGWDMRTRYSGLRGDRLSAHAFGHGGFTGTSLWIDPDQDLFVIFLSNRVHPDGKGYVIPLAAAIADVAAARIGTSPAARSCRSPTAVRTGLDVLRRDGFAQLQGRRVGLIMHNASHASDGATALALLANAPGVTLAALFAPEHGLASDSEGAVKNSQLNGLPVYSLFGKTRKPTREMLRGLDTLVFDLADVGVRFFTYMSTLRCVLEAAAEHGLEVVVLDRPNPLGAAHAEGPVRAASIETFVNYHRLPVMHGLTAGELAELLNSERKIHAKLRVIPMEGFTREMQFADTGLRWYAPSPNLPTPDAALLYPATGLLESSHLSVGRGTEHPFAFVGAPWLDGPALASALSQRSLPGVKFEPLAITPRSDRWRGQLCSGVLLQLTDRRAFRPVQTGLSIASEILRQAPQKFHAEEIGPLVAEPNVVRALAQGTSPAELERLWELDLQRFEAIRRRYLRYPYCE